MNLSHTIAIAGNPPTQTHQARLRAFKIGKHCRIVKAKPDAATVAFQADLKAQVISLRTNLGRDVLCAGPVHLRIVFEFAYLRSHKATGSRIPKVSRPDLDNMAKTILDALTEAGAFDDDSQVAHLEMLKVFGPTPATLISITEFPL
jgi:Holliday junction resolvase RusA-like endonuclease